MSAILGTIYRNSNHVVEISRLSEMLKTVSHRGPCGEAFYVAPGISLAVCYWNPEQIISADILHSDYVPPDDQYPGSVLRTINGDGTVAVIMDGEIYNIDVLRRELEAEDHDFYTTDDAEVILHLYELLGPDELFPKLRGKFSVAIWDARRQQLLLARDRIGQKPLYVYQDEEKLIFASELKAILAHGNIKKEICPTAIEDYFIMECVPAPRTIYKHVKKIPAASWQIFQPLWGKNISAGNAWISEHEPRKYWSFQITEDESDEEITEEQWKEIIIDTLEDTVNYMKGGFIPAGAFLSGGLDSSIIVAIQSRWGGESIPTFSIGFAEAEFNELEYAEAVSERFGTDHYEEIVTPNAAAELNTLVECYDEPYADPAALPMMLVARLAAKHVTAVFSGDGGDESFAGYARHIHDMREDHLRRILPMFLRRGILGKLGDIYPRLAFLPKCLRWKTALTNIGLSAAEAYANTASYCRNPLRKKLLAPLFRTPNYTHSDISQQYITAFQKAPVGNTLAGMLMAEVNFALPEAMVKVDRATMYCGLEVRSPFLDHEMLAVAARVPSDLKIDDGLGKWILRQSFEPQLPSKLKNRPKQGFEIPIDAWLRGPLKQIFMTEVFHKDSRISEWVDIPTVRKLYEHHCAKASHDGRFLWSLLILASWMKRWEK
ncbi:MAG: asparagine synthase (glutamine-hydrolyzing) [Planctomycetia bacterium]|nr:asparagine synthase (glutamine-hydrolyzing) [Planctomycetia bacterium]